MRTKRRYDLRLYDQTLLSFTCTSGDGDIDVYEIDRVDSDSTHLLPPRLVVEQSDAVLADWLSGRVIPKNRAFVDRILEQAGLSDASPMDIISVCKGLSTTDAYWVVPDGFDGA